MKTSPFSPYILGWCYFYQGGEQTTRDAKKGGKVLNVEKLVNVVKVYKIIRGWEMMDQSQVQVANQKWQRL